VLSVTVLRAFGWREGAEKGGCMLIPGFKIFNQEKQSLSIEHNLEEFPKENLNHYQIF
jgi:hypothetical protein